jgi:SOS-response transcriptional repressor LexA
MAWLPEMIILIESPVMSNPCQPVPLDKIRVPITARTFALEVKGGGLEDLHLRAGDIVVCEHGSIPAPGDLIAALADDENSIGLLVSARGRMWLRRGRAEIPVDDLVIQGVVRAVVRRVPAGA